MDFYDRHGNAVAYVDDGEHIYSWDGRPVAFISGEHVYTFSGNFIGWWADWPAPGSEDTELGVLMEREVRHGAAEVHARVQA